MSGSRQRSRRYPNINLETVLADLQFYHHSSIATTTIHTYSTAVNSYLQFCQCLPVTPFPVSEHILQLYISHLARSVTYGTIKVYLAGIQYTSITLGLPMDLTDMHLLYYTMRGIRRVLGDTNRPRRQPITVLHIRQLFDFITSSQLHPTDKLLLRSAITLAFFGLLRSSEYTVQSVRQFEATYTLLISDVHFSPNGNIVFVNIKSSKTDPFKVGVLVRIGAIGNDICPVHSLRLFLQHCQHNSGPLYTFTNGQYLTRSYLSQLIQQIWPNSNLNTHSFRIGGASSAAAAGISDSTIQILGRWSSNAYHRYIRVSDDNIINSVIRMSSAINVDRIWNPDSTQLPPRS